VLLLLLLLHCLPACSPHGPHQALRHFEPGLLRDHCVKHPGSGIVEQLLAAPDWGDDASAADKERVKRMNERERAALKRAGRRPTADGLMQCVLGHNGHARLCMHFSEDRWEPHWSLACCSSSVHHAAAQPAIAGRACVAMCEQLTA
jgi:hypothetical protein